MYKHLHNNIQTGNDRIEKIKSKILFNEFKRKYQKNTSIDSGECHFKKVPYIKNNTNKLLISRGYLSDCSRNIYCNDKIDVKLDVSCNFWSRHLDTNNNFYSQKTFNDFDVFTRDNGGNNWEISKNKLNEVIPAVNTIYNYNEHKNEKHKMKKLNEKLNEKLKEVCKDDKYKRSNCESQIKISSLNFLGNVVE